MNPQQSGPLFLCYCDESGDMGRRPRSKPWFFLSSCVIRATKASHVTSYIDEAKKRAWSDYGRTPPSEIDWKSLKHAQRTAILPIFTSKPYSQVVIGVWKQYLTRPSNKGLGNPLNSYLYCCRLLIERLSWFVRDNNGYARIVFSQTDRLDLPSLKEYLKKIMTEPGCKIAPVFNIEDIRVSSMKKVKLLTLADNITSSFAGAFNPDHLDNLYPQYAQPTIPHLYRYKNVGIWKYGFKLLPHDLSKQILIDKYPLMKDWL